MYYHKRSNLSLGIEKYWTLVQLQFERRTLAPDCHVGGYANLAHQALVTKQNKINLLLLTYYLNNPHLAQYVNIGLMLNREQKKVSKKYFAMIGSLWIVIEEFSRCQFVSLTSMLMLANLTIEKNKQQKCPKYEWTIYMKYIIYLWILHCGYEIKWNHVASQLWAQISVVSRSLKIFRLLDAIEICAHNCEATWFHFCPKYLIL